MATETEQRSIGKLFEKLDIIKVPKFQRAYAWEENEISDFVDDIGKCLRARISFSSRSHFFGGIVCVKSKVPNSSGVCYEIIDGQQRISSFVLLISALIEAMNCIVKQIDSSTASTEDVEIKQYLETAKRKADEEFLHCEHPVNCKYENVPKLQLSDADDNFFQRVIKGERPKTTKSTPQSHQRILYARNALLKFVTQEISRKKSVSEKATVVNQLLNYVITEDCEIVLMWSDSKVDAYRIFQVLNDRGARLRTGDLLRARTLEMLDDEEFQVQQMELSKCWDDILKYSHKSVDDYLFWYYASYQGERPKISEVTNQFMEIRFSSKSDLLATSQSQANAAVSEVEKIREDFETLDQLMNHEWPYNSGVIGREVTKWDVSRLGLLVGYLKQTSVLPLLLALTLLPQNKFAVALASIERFIFRYKTIVGAHISPASSLFHKQAKLVRDNPAGYDVSQLRRALQKLVEKRAGNDVFSTKIRDLTYPGKRREIRYMLLTIEDYHEWLEDGAKGEPECRNKMHVLDIHSTTIEHIQFKNPKLIDKEMKKVVNTIGNLALLGPKDNSTLGDKPYSDKRDTYQRSNLTLNQILGKNGTWTKSKIQSRTKELTDKAVEIFIP